MAPIPIIIPISATDGKMSLAEFVFLLWFCQIVLVWLFVLCDEIKNRKLLLVWHVPFIPIFVLMIIKFINMGKEKSWH
jgi:hypothetical protein